MTLVKISNVGDGEGALLVTRDISIPTYGDPIETADAEYEVTEVHRFMTNKRADAVRVNVTRV